MILTDTSSTSPSIKGGLPGEIERGGTAAVGSWFPSSLGAIILLGALADPSAGQSFVRATRVEPIVSSTRRKDVLVDAITTEDISSSSTSAIETRSLREMIEGLFAAGRQQDFEDGVHSNFSSQLIQIVTALQSTALGVIASLILHEKVNPAVSAEALKWLGYFEHRGTYSYRLWLLERALFNSSTRVRDAAAIGLASMDDPHAIASLREAAEKETCDELRLDIQQVITQLDSQCHLSLEQ